MSLKLKSIWAIWTIYETIKLVTKYTLKYKWKNPYINKLSENLIAKNERGYIRQII